MLEELIVKDGKELLAEDEDPDQNQKKYWSDRNVYVGSRWTLKNCPMMADWRGNRKMKRK